MFNTKFSPKANNAKIESVDDAIKRGVKLQTCCVSNLEINKEGLVEPKKIKSHDNPFNADHYKLLKSLGIIK